MDKKITVLHIVNKMDRAGAETMIMNIMRKIDSDKYIFKFLVKTKAEGQYDDEIRKLGGEIFHIDRLNFFNMKKYKKSLSTFYKEHSEIDIVHAHQGSSAYYDTKEAKKRGIIAIAHSHNTYTNRIFDIKEILFKIASFRTRFVCDAYIGCSQNALTSRYGREIQKRKKCYLLHNGINLTHFNFSKELRHNFRMKYGIKDNDIVLAFVGRLTNIKNPFFALEVFKRFHTFHPNSYMLYAGSGPLYNKLKEKIEKYGLIDKVFVLGNIENVDELMDASDCLIMPSLKEGFPVTLVEAQTNGLPCFISNKITKEVELSKLVTFLPISSRKNIKLWANLIASAVCEKQFICSRKTYNNDLIEAFSDINTVSSLCKIYTNLLKSKGDINES